jgi:hypothetical protein
MQTLDLKIANDTLFFRIWEVKEEWIKQCLDQQELTENDLPNCMLYDSRV